MPPSAEQVVHHFRNRPPLSARVCNEYHVQITGGRFVVNYYPTTGTMYVNGTNRKLRRRAVSCRELEKAANEPPPKVPRCQRMARHNRAYYRDVKKNLWRKHRICYWCHQRIEHWRDATVEHVIPLARGGSNGLDNLMLAHEACNKAHDDGEGLFSPDMDWKRGHRRCNDEDS